jgi:hypothetical protein
VGIEAFDGRGGGQLDAVGDREPLPRADRQRGGPVGDLDPAVIAANLELAAAARNREAGAA